MYDPVVLFSQASQSWQHIICDELVYLIESTEGNADAGFLLTKNYDRGQCWWEVLVGTSTEYIAAIISNLRSEQSKIAPNGNSECTPGNSGNHGSHKNSAMLVDSVQLMQLPKLRGCQGRACRSVVWLKRFDKLDSFVRYAENLSVKSLSGLSVKRFSENRELSPVGIGVLQASYGPDGLIQRCSQALEYIGGDQENADMWMLDLDTIANSILPRLFMGREGIGFRFSESLDCNLKFFKVYLRPLGLEISIS